MCKYQIEKVDYDSNGVRLRNIDPYIYRGLPIDEVAKLSKIDRDEILWSIEEHGECTVDVDDNGGECWVITEQEGT